MRLAHRLGGSYDFTFVLLTEPGSSGGGRSDSGGDRVHVLSRGPALDWNCAYRLAALLGRERVDLVHAHQHAAFLCGLTARLLQRRPAVLLTEHRRPDPDHPSRRRIVVNRMLLEARDRIVAASSSIRRALIYNEGLPPEQIEVIYDGIELAPTAGEGPGARALRQELGVGADDLLILQVAPPGPQSDQTLALRALQRVVGHRPEAHLALVGGRPEVASIGELAGQQGLGPHVHRLDPRADLAQLLAAADLVLLTGPGEDDPQPLARTLAAGRPVVATRTGSVGEIVDDGICGLLADPGDDATLAAHILRLGADPALRQQMGRRGRQRAEALFSEATMAAQYDRIYREMIEAAEDLP